MSTYSEIIKKKQKEWGCDDLLSSASTTVVAKIPFSSPMMNYATYGGIPRSRITEFFGDPGCGKAQPLYSLVLTPDGFVRMGDILAGDTIYDGAGNLCMVDGVYPQGKRKVYEITTHGSNKIRVADNHLNCVYGWNAETCCIDEYVLTTDELIAKFTSLVGSDKLSIKINVPSGMKINESYTEWYEQNKAEPFKDIISIEYIGEEECQCIHVDSDLHTYISDDFIVTHNTTTAVDICKNACKLFQEEYEKQLSDLQLKLSSGNKSAKAELADLQERGRKKILYIDLEHSFDKHWSDVIGIKPEDIDVMQPPNVVAEDILQTIQELIESGEVGLIVLDSIASLVPRKELEKKFGEATVASLAGLLNVFFRKIVPLLTRYGTTFIYINQTRDNLTNPYVVNTPGGKAPKFYASLRMLFKIDSPVDFLGNTIPQNSENPAGYIVSAKIVKQKSGSFDRKLGSYYLMCSSGIRPDYDFAQLAIKKYNIIRKAGAWFTLCDPTTGMPIEDEEGNLVKLNGLARVYEYLESNHEYMKELQDFIINDINSASVSEQEYEESEE